MKRVTTFDIQSRKDRGERIPMVTVYDYTAARLVSDADIPMLLVGDSLGQMVLGHPTTLPVTVEDMVSATAAVVRGAPHLLVVADLPFMSFQAGTEDAIRNAGRLLKEGGAQAVKVEGGSEVRAGQVRALGEAGIPVMGHIGLTPQAVHKLGGYRVQGRTPLQADSLVEAAVRLEEAGAFAVVLELMPVEVAALITERLSIPTIGIGSGIVCDGEVQVWHDVLGLSVDFQPRHSKKFAEVGDTIRAALRNYADEVRAGSFPTEAQTVHSTKD